MDDLEGLMGFVVRHARDFADAQRRGRGGKKEVLSHRKYLNHLG